MPVHISKQLKEQLPESDRKDIETLLWNKSAQKCFLCGGELIESTHNIVVDHDTPKAEGGPTALKNLNLTHSACNSFKQNHKSTDVRPYLTLVQRINAAGGFVKYDQAIGILGIHPISFDLEEKGNKISVTSPEHGKRDYPIFVEKSREREFRFCYIELQPQYIFNDDECQPRTIKPAHLWQIYLDILRNPLHEAPACRIEKIPQSQRSYKALLFDGQHKALAFWIAGRKTVTIKLYLNLDKDSAIRLVNSVQSKIKKLPLSPFELSAKMSEEWQERFQQYGEEKGSENTSEADFFNWVDKDERTRAKQAFEDALYNDILFDDQLEIKPIIAKPSQAVGPFQISESTFRNKVLKVLLHTKPLDKLFSEQQKMRKREHDIIILVLNLFNFKIFRWEGDPSEQQKIRAKRFLYQSSLAYCMSEIRNSIGHILYTRDGNEFLEKEPDSKHWKQIEDCIDRLIEHPVWTADFSLSPKMKKVEDALSKNQDAATAFESVGLKSGYLVGADKLPANCVG